MKIFAALFCAVMLALVGYLAIFIMPVERQHRAANEQWANERDKAFVLARNRLERSDRMIMQIRAAFPNDFAQYEKLIADAKTNPNLVVREQIEIRVVRTMVEQQQMYVLSAGSAALREVLRARRNMLSAMLEVGTVAQCASMFTGANSPPLPNDERLLKADADQLQARLTAAIQGSTNSRPNGLYTQTDNQAFHQAILSIPTDIPNPVASFKGRRDEEACRLGILHDDARLMLPDDGTFERAAVWSLTAG